MINSNAIKTIKIFKRIPEGSAALFFIQIFATLSYAVLYSTLVLFMKQGLDFSTTEANSVMGSFIAFNYGLHLLGGFFGGRNLSYRNLFITGIGLQITGVLLLSVEARAAYYWGLATFLTGSGLNVTCINMMVTQLFKPEDKRREAAFLWNYSGMNLGFFLGFALAGFFQLHRAFHELFIATSISGVITVIIAGFNWQTIRDRNTPLVTSKTDSYLQRTLIGTFAILIMIPILHWLLGHANLSNQLIIATGIAMGVTIFILGINQTRAIDKMRIFAFIILSLASLVFWSMYQLAPMGLTVFALYNVDRHVFGFTISPQWIQNINAIVIIIGGPMMVIFLKLIRKYINFSIPLQFATSLFLIGIGFLLLPLGIHYADAMGYMNFDWIAWSYVLQSLGELLISPIGYAMIGLLAPPNLQGILMGTWMLTQGVAGVLSSYFSNYAISSFTSTDPLVTNPGYSHTFGLLGGSAILCGVVLTFLIPLLRRLINEKIE